MGDRRPALDVHVPVTAASLFDIVDAVTDDYRPFAVQAVTPAIRRIYFFSRTDRDDAAHALTARLTQHHVKIAPVDIDDDGAYWAARSQADLQSVRIGRIIVAPPWDVPEESPATTTIVIQPSMGFGTGHHESTRLCLRALQEASVTGLDVIDLGSGSGVLAIAAAKLGARTVLAIECDCDAVASARDNIAANQVASIVQLIVGDLQTVDRPRPGHVVLANLTGDALSRHADAIFAWAMTGGTLIASGVTRNEETAVLDALRTQATLRDRTVEGDWVGLVMEAS